MDGRVAIVTGASRGIGQHIAERFAAEGAAVALVARTMVAGASRLPGSIEEVVSRILERGGTAVAVPADLTVPGEVETIVARAEDALGPVDTLVNNAGVNFYGPALEISPRRFEVTFQILVYAPFRLCQLAIPGMVQRRRGWVLNISSKQARHPMGPPYPEWARDGCVPYGMGKAALDRMTTGLAAEVEPFGVVVNSLGTWGLVVTPGATTVSPHTAENVPVEPPSAMADAAVLLCTAPAGTTGRIAYSMELLGDPLPEGPWALSATG
jgi:citronellol/citronellal dehydrogenase